MSKLFKWILIGGTTADPQVALVDPALPGFTRALIRLTGKGARSSFHSLLESLSELGNEKEKEE